MTENISPDCSCNLECQVMTFHLQLERKTLRELLAKRPDISVHSKFYNYYMETEDRGGREQSFLPQIQFSKLVSR